MLMTSINKRIGYHKDTQKVVFFIAVVAQECSRTCQLMYFFGGWMGVEVLIKFGGLYRRNVNMSVMGSFLKIFTYVHIFKFKIRRIRSNLQYLKCGQYLKLCEVFGHMFFFHWDCFLKSSNSLLHDI